MVLFLNLAQLADELASTSSRLKKRAAIAAGIAAAHLSGDRHDAGLFAMYLSGEAFSEADTRKLNIGGAMLTKTVREIVSPTEAQFTAAWRRHGDLGAAAGDLFAERGHTPEPSITLQEIEAAFAQIPVAKTTAARQGLLANLLRRCTPVEAKYLIKLINGDMRIGVKQSLVEEAIAVASEQPLAALRNAVMLEADLSRATEMAFEGRLDEARMRLFHPLGFMLASPVETPEEAVARFASKPEAARDADIAAPPQSSAEPKPHIVAEDESAMTDPAVEHAPIEDLRMRAQIEDKYDGMRVQLHCGDTSQAGRVALYSRNREDVTASYPEIVEAFARVSSALQGLKTHVSEAKRGAPDSAEHLGVDEVGTCAVATSEEGAPHLASEMWERSYAGIILDGELLAWDVRADRAMPFAVLSPRIGRKRVTNDIRVSTPVVFMAFDLLFAGGELLLDLPLRERRGRLEALAAKLQRVTCSPLELVPPLLAGGLLTEVESDTAQGEQRLRLSPVLEAHSAEELDRAYVAARDRGNEGVMIKASESLYQPGRRGLSWMKLKRHLDTLDVVITGAEYGQGRKSQFLSDYTFAVRGPGGDLLNVGKAYSGVTDMEIAELTEWCKAHTLEDFGHFRSVEPLVVLEVAFNNIMRSDRHASGFALRFPRIVQVRQDKPLDEIDTLQRVEEIYQSQPDKPAEGSA
jgi:DNA ligase-1